MKPQFIDLLQIVLPMLVKRELGFKIIRNTALSGSLLEGQLGSIYVGKMIGIYQTDDKEVFEIARELISITKAFKGPFILTDKCLSGVYTRYKSFNPTMLKRSSGHPVKHIYSQAGKLIPDPYEIPFSLPSGIKWPFKEISSHIHLNRTRLLNGRSVNPHDILHPMSARVNTGYGNSEYFPQN